MRLFIGIPLSEEARRGVREVVKTLKKKHWKVKWEDEEKWHVTLAFIGELEVGEVGKVWEVVEGVAKQQKIFTLRFGGLGQFHNKVIWLGVKGEVQKLHELRQQIGIDTKPFYPHVTLGRAKQVVLPEEKVEITQEWVVDRVCLYESVLKPEGSEYRIINTVELYEPV